MIRNASTLLFLLSLFAWTQAVAQKPTFKIIPKDVTLQKDEIKEWDLVVDNFSGIIATEFAITFDANLLQFQNVTFIDTTNLVTAGMFYTPPNDPEPPGIRFVWANPSALGVNLPNGKKIASFRLKGLTAGTATISFGSEPPYTREILDFNGNDLDFNQVNGNVVIQSSAPVDSTAIQIKLQSSEVVNGGSICMPVVATKNFTAMDAAQFEIFFDNTKLKYTGVTNCHPALSMGCNNGSSAVINVVGGVLYFAWTDPNLNGITLQPGATMFEICFEELGNAGDCGSVAFNPDPDTWLFVNHDGVKKNFLPMNGQVCIIAPPSNVTIKLDTLILCKDSFALMPIRAIKYKNIDAVEIYLQWNDAKLQFVGFQGCNPLLSISDCGGLSNFTHTSNSATFTWINPLIPNPPPTIPDSGILFYIKYKILMTTLGDTACVIRKCIPNQSCGEVVYYPSGLGEEFGFKQGCVQVGECPKCVIKINDYQASGVTCFSANDGKIQLAISGTTNYTVKWSGPSSGQQNNNATINNLAAGIYNITVIDNGTPNCFVEQPNIEVKNISFTFDQMNVQPTCTAPNSGSITLTITGGKPPYTITWTYPDGSTKIGNPITNLGPGKYTPVVKDANNCELAGTPITLVMADININPVVVNPSCAGSNNGSIIINVSPTGANYTYTWNPLVSNSNSAFGLGAGVYKISVTDVAKNCTVPVVPDITLTAPPDITVGTPVITNVNCFGAQTGSILLPGIGVGYTFNWSNGTSANPATNLKANTYNVVITQTGSGCTKSITGLVVGENTELKVTTTNVKPTVGQNNGSILLNVSGGLPQYNYTWVPNVSNTGFAANLAAGTYQITVTDAVGCSKELTVVLTNADLTNVTFINVSSYHNDQYTVSCGNTCDGSATAVPPGAAVQPVNYKWSTSAGGVTTPNATGLCAGLHKVTITDATNISFVGSIIMTAPFSWSINVQTGGQSPNAFAQALVGGLPQLPINYLWSTGQATPYISPIDQGEYCITVTDNYNCKEVECVDVFNVDCLTGRTVFTPNNDGKNDEFIINCAGNYDDHKMEIFNRWGQVVFISTSFTNWDGTNPDGTEAPTGAYYWVFTYKDDNQIRREVKGNVSLLR